eukprot:7863116-Karenia_brevis.AAC.1
MGRQPPVLAAAYLERRCRGAALKSVRGCSPRSGHACSGKRPRGKTWSLWSALCVGKSARPAA